MIIGLTLLGLVAVLLAFGVAGRVFKNSGMPYPLAFAVVGALIGCAFIPTFVAGEVSICVAGFIAPVLAGTAFFVLALRSGELWRSTVAAFATMCMYVALWVTVPPFLGDGATAAISGVLCAAVAFAAGKTRVSVLAATFCGMAVGDIVSSAVGVFAYGQTLRLGSAAAFDAIMIASVFAVLIFEGVAAVKRAAVEKRRALAETAEEFDIDEYKKYFDE